MLEQFEIVQDGDVKLKKLSFSMKKVIQSITVFLIILFFCPLCVVSCGGETVNVSGVTSTIGVEMYGERTRGNFLCIFLLLIPICILVVSVMKQITDLKMKYVYNAILATVEVIAWIAYYFGVKGYAENYGCEVKYTLAYFLSVMISILIAVGTLGSALKLQEVFGGENVILQKLMSAVKQEKGVKAIKKIEVTQDDKEAYPRICYKCGNILKKDMNFCPKCGTPYKDPEKNNLEN